MLSRLSLLGVAQPFRLGALDQATWTTLAHGAWLDVLPGWIRGADALFERLLARVPWRGERWTIYDQVLDLWVPKTYAIRRYSWMTGICQVHEQVPGLLDDPGLDRVLRGERAFAGTDRMLAGSLRHSHGGSECLSGCPRASLDLVGELPEDFRRRQRFGARQRL